MRVKAVFVVFCLTVLVNFSTAAQPIGPFGPIQPGQEEAYDAGFYTTLDLSQTIEGVTVGLSWAYADPWYIQVGLARILNQHGGRLKIVSAMLRLADSDEPAADLGDGSEHPDAHWLSWRYPIPFGEETFDPNGHLAVYDLFETFPEQLDFDLTIRLEVMPPSPTPAADLPTLAPEVTPEPTPKPEPVYHDYEFSFTVKPYPVRIIKPDTGFEENGLQVTINQLAITPIRTIVDFCYTVLDSIDTWYPSNEDLESYYGDNEITLFEQFGGNPTQLLSGDAGGCRRYDAQLFHDGVESPFTFEIRTLTTGYVPAENHTEEIGRYIDENGIDAPPRYDQDGKLVGFQLSHEMFLDVAVALGYMKRMDGLWLINVPIPPQD